MEGWLERAVSRLEAALGVPPADLLALGAAATGALVLTTIAYLWLTSTESEASFSTPSG